MSKSTHLLFAAVSTLTAAVASLCTSAADFKAFNYETPAYVDIEFGELAVDESTGTVSINILRTGDFRQSTTIEYQTSEDSASEGKDYKGSGGSLTFQPGEGFKTVTIEIVADSETESAETFVFEITGATPEAMVMRSSAIVTIADSELGGGPTPRLEIVAAPQGQVVLAWEGSENCVIERTENPASGVWEAVECSVNVRQNRCEAIQAAGERFYFYRLRTP